MEHFFEQESAKVLGLEPAVVLRQIEDLINEVGKRLENHNSSCPNVHHINGYTVYSVDVEEGSFMYLDNDNLNKMFPYLSAHKVRSIILKLSNLGLIQTTLMKVYLMKVRYWIKVK